MKPQLPNLLAAALLLPLSLLLGLALGACQPETSPSPDSGPALGTAKSTASSARATRVEVAVMGATAAGVSRALPGEVEAKREAMLASAMGGFVERVLVKEGDTVRKDQPLVLVDSASHNARLRQTEVEVEAAEREYERLKRIGDAVPAINLDQADTRLKAARAAYRAASIQASRAVVRAPFAGSVDTLNIEAGEVAAPGAPLVRMLDLDTLMVTVSLSDRDVMAVKPDQAVTVTTDAQMAPVTGKVTRVRRAADTNTRAFEAEIELDNAAGGLLPGMIATVRIQSQLDDAQLVVRNDWLVTKLDSTGVFVNVDGVASYREVELGPVVGNQIAVTKGLKRGDELIVNGHRELAEGDPVLVARRGNCCTDGRVVYEGTER